MKIGLHKTARAVFALVGTALAVSCSSPETEPREQENIMTMRSDTLTITQTENGVPSTYFFTSMMEEYAYAPEPYREFPRGIEVKSYDSLGKPKSALRANYALFWLALERWDLKGDVVGTNAEGDMIETQQLTWNQKTELVWTNVQTRFTLKGDIIVATGFESTQDLKKWRLRNGDGTQTIAVDSDQDSLRQASPAPSAQVWTDEGVKTVDNTTAPQSTLTTAPQSAAPPPAAPPATQGFQSPIFTPGSPIKR